MKKILLNKIKNKSVHIAVLGLGYIGLSAESMFATHRLRVTGVDTDRDAVKTLNKGEVQLQLTVIQSHYRLISKSPYFPFFKSPCQNYLTSEIIKHSNPLLNTK